MPDGFAEIPRGGMQAMGFRCAIPAGFTPGPFVVCKDRGEIVCYFSMIRTSHLEDSVQAYWTPEVWKLGEKKDAAAREG